MKSLSERIGNVLGESKQQFMRFDCDARLEVFVTQDELEDALWGSYPRGKVDLRKDPRPEEEKIKIAKEAAVRLAREMNDDVRRFQITADIDLDKVNIDKIDWVALVTPEPEEVD